MRVNEVIQAEIAAQSKQLLIIVVLLIILYCYYYEVVTSQLGVVSELGCGQLE